MSGLLPRMLGRKPIEYDLMRFKAGAGLDIPNPLYVYNVYPWSDFTYDLGSESLRFDEVFTGKVQIRGTETPSGGTLEDVTTGSSPTVPRLRLEAATPTENEYAGSRLQLRAPGYQDDLADLCWIDVRSGAQSTAKLISFLYGSETTPRYYFYAGNMSMVGYAEFGGGVNITTGFFSTTLEDGVLMQGETPAPGNPTANGVSKLWLSDGVGGTAGDLMVKIREGGSTRTFVLASHSAGAGNNVFTEYLYHAGDLDTYIRFQDDQVSLAAGGAVFLDFTEDTDDVLTLAGGSLQFVQMTESGAGQSSVIWNSADADVDFRWDSTAGDGALFVEGSSGKIAIGHSDPQRAFHVEGAAGILAVLQPTTDNAEATLLLMGGTAGNLVGEQGQVGYDGANNRFFIRTSSGLAGGGDEKLTIDRDTGNVTIASHIGAIGAAAHNNAAIDLTGTLTGGGVSQRGILMGNLTATSSATTEIEGLYVAITTPDTVFTTANVYGIQVAGVLKGASHTITRASGVAIAACPTATHSTVLLVGTPTIPDGTYALYSASAADSYFAADVGIGTISPDQLLHVELADSATNWVTYPQRISHITSGTAVAGFGAGLEFELEENDTSNKIAAIIEVKWQDAGEGTNADAYFDFKTMLNDAAAASVMVVGYNGVVGIGTAAPDSAHALDISGNIRLQGGAQGIHFNNGADQVEGIRQTAGAGSSIQLHGNHVTISTAGRVGILQTVPTGQLHVYQSGAAAAIPVVHLDQEDVDREFIRFTGTSALSITQSLVDNDDIGTSTLVGWKKIYVVDEGNRITDGPYYVPFYTLTAGWQLVAMSAAELGAAGEQATVINV